MSRTENDLRAALRELEQRADEHGAPSAATILGVATEDRPSGRRTVVKRRFPRWLPPVAAAAAVAATAITAMTLSSQPNGSSQPGPSPTGGRSAAGHTPLPRSATTSRHTPTSTARPTSAATVLDDAAAALVVAPGWRTPAPQDFFYVRTTNATTWTSVSGRQAGDGRAADGTKIWMSGCRHGRIVSTGESGTCTLNDVSHYLADAPTAAPAWDAYLERMAPGAKAGGAQGKIIVQVLHQDLLAPKAAAALLRYTTSCPGLHTLTVRPVTGEKLIGVTCTSMTNGSHGLVFDAASHHLVGFVVVTSNGRQADAAEIIRQTGIVSEIGRTP